MGQGSAPQRLSALLDTFWKYQMIERPELATHVGFPGQNDRLTDMSLGAIARRREEVRCLHAALTKIPRTGLRGEDRVTYDLVDKDLRESIDGFRFGSEYLELDHLGGLQTHVAGMAQDMPAQNAKDYRNIIARFEKIPERQKQTEILLREGLKRGITPLKMFLGRVPQQFDRVLTAKVEDSPIYKPFTEMHSSIGAEERAKIQSEARAAIETKVYPALKALREFVVNEYIPGARENIAWTSVPNGKEWYAHLVKESTTTDMTPDQLHDLGLSEVKRISGEMDKVREQVGFKGDLKAFNKFLLSDKRFYYSKPEELLAGYREIGKRIDPELPKLFKTLPRLTYGVREMAAYKAAESPAAYYIPGSLEAGRPGFFEANTFDLKARPKWAMEALTAHEAVPGHHFQISLAQELTGLPEMRKQGGHTAFVEGWGLYAESLGPEMGLYKDPYSHYGQLTFEMWRAVRLVVDTGMHAKGWTRDQAIEYFMAQMPKSKLEAEVEIDRYLTWPGQALAYKVGELKFKELRARAAQELGQRFNVRDFHDEVLRHGSLPMDVLDKTVSEWIAKEKRIKNRKT